jgi:hypothetical protein
MFSLTILVTSGAGSFFLWLFFTALMLAIVPPESVRVYVRPVTTGAYQVPCRRAIPHGTATG